MLEKFIHEQFNGDRKEAIKCIANELSSLKYEKTGSVEECRKYAQQLTPSEKQEAYQYFKKNLEAKKSIDNKLSRLTLSYDEVKNAEEDKHLFYKNLAIDVLIILLINIRAIYIGAIPFVEFFSVIVTPFALLSMLKILIRHFRFKSAKEYIENESELMEQLKNVYGNSLNDMDFEEQEKVL